MSATPNRHERYEQIKFRNSHVVVEKLNDKHTQRPVHSENDKTIGLDSTSWTSRYYDW